MIRDVLSTINTELADGSTGLNARITALNSSKSTSANAVVTFVTWGDVTGMPSEIKLPAIMVSEASGRFELENQSLRHAEYRIGFAYFTGTVDPSDARDDATITLHALAKILDNLHGNGTIEAVRSGVDFAIMPWPEAGSVYTAFSAVATILEHDTSP